LIQNVCNPYRNVTTPQTVSEDDLLHTYKEQDNIHIINCPGKLI